MSRLSAGRAVRHATQRLERPFDSAPPRRKSAAKIIRLPSPEKVIRDNEVAEIIRNLLWATFPAPSARDCARQASPALGCSVDTVERLLSKRTKDASARIFLRLCVVCLARGQDPIAVAGVREVWDAYQKAMP